MNLAVLLLAGVLAGVIVHLLPVGGGHPPWLRWSSLVGLSLAVGAIMWVLRYLDRRFVRRGIQLALVLSLLAHVVVGIVMAT